MLGLILFVVLYNIVHKEYERVVQFIIVEYVGANLQPLRMKSNILHLLE